MNSFQKKTKTKTKNKITEETYGNHDTKDIQGELHGDKHAS